MSDGEQVSQALAELWDIVRCRCHEAYTGRGLHDPACECDSTDAVQTVADRIEALTKDRDTAREYAGEVRKREMAAEDARISATDKLAKAVEALDDIKRYSSCGDTRRKAIETIAEIKGESHD